MREREREREIAYRQPHHHHRNNGRHVSECVVAVAVAEGWREREERATLYHSYMNAIDGHVGDGCLKYKS